MLDFHHIGQKCKSQFQLVKEVFIKDKCKQIISLVIKELQGHFNFEPFTIFFINSVTDSFKPVVYTQVIKHTQ